MNRTDTYRIHYVDYTSPEYHDDPTDESKIKTVDTNDVIGWIAGNSSHASIVRTENLTKKLKVV